MFMSLYSIDALSYNFLLGTIVMKQNVLDTTRLKKAVDGVERWKEI